MACISTLESLSGLENLEFLSIRSSILSRDPFQGLTTLKHLTMWYCDFKNANSNLFECLPSLQVLRNHCGKNQHHIEYFKIASLKCLSYGGKKSISCIKNLQPSLVYLSTSGPFIELTNRRQIHAFFSHVKNSTLKALNLTGNQFCRFDAQWLAGFANLRHLIFSRNHISTVEFDYDFLSQIESICLDLNNLESLDFAFSRFSNLKSLNLSDNSRLRLNSEVFYGLDKLEELFISSVGHSRRFSSYNKLKDVFQNLNNLKTLDISSNYLTQLDAEMFLSTPNLIKLDLSGNKLELDRDCFIHVGRKLEFLDLSRNSLKNVDGIFSNLKELKALNLAGNKLAEVNASTFEGLDNLNDLNLVDNKFEHRDRIDAKSFAHIKNLQVRLDYGLFRELSMEEKEIFFGRNVDLIL